MGRNFSVAVLLAASVVTASAQRPVPPAPPPTPPPDMPASELYKQGQDLASRGDHVTAVGALARALEKEPANWEYKLALADAERQSNQCDKALPRYKELLDSAPEGEKARVRTHLQQCPNAFVFEVKSPPPPAPPAPPPKIIEKEGPPNLTNVALFAGAGLCLGASLGFYLAARADDDDAESARSFKDHERISTRADQEKIAAVVLLGGAVALGGWAVYRIKFKKSETTEVAVTPTPDGGAVMVRGAW